MIAFYISMLALFIVISMAWTALKGAPWLPSRMGDVNRMLQLAGVKPGEKVYDLGCGDGRVLVTAAKKYGAKAVGVELDPFRYAWSKGLVYVMGLRGDVEVIHGDLFKTDISDADVVFCYLLHHTNLKLDDKLLSPAELEASQHMGNFYPVPHSIHWYPISIFSASLFAAYQK